MDSYFESWKQKVFSNQPELWSFFENSSDYCGQTPDDYDCQRWQDTLTLAYIIRIGLANVPFQCSPGKLSQHYSESYRGHDSEEGIDFYDYCVESVSKEDYDLARSQKKEGINTESDIWTIERVLYIGRIIKEFLDDDYLVIKREWSMWGKIVTIAATVKGIKGYYIFTFEQD